MARGRKTGGRKAGVPNRVSRATRQAVTAYVAAAAEAIGPDRFLGDAHAFLSMVYQDPQLPLSVRLDAAKTAIRYERPALQATHVSSSEDSITAGSDDSVIIYLPDNGRGDGPIEAMMEPDPDSADLQTVFRQP
jgi:hypothetical protein